MSEILGSFFRFFIRFLIQAYRILLSPVLGGQCRFYPSCSEYAEQTLHKHSPFKAVLKIAGRLCRCHPFHPGGCDPA